LPIDASRSPLGTPVQPQFGDVARVGLEFAALDLFDNIDEPLVGARLQPDLRALADDKAVEELDFRAPALLHILAHGRTLLGRTARLRQHSVLVARERLGVALAGAGDYVGRQVVDLLELIAKRLADADCLAADARLETADRVDLGHLRAGQPGAGRDAVRHRIRHQFRPALAP